MGAPHRCVLAGTTFAHFSLLCFHLQKILTHPSSETSSYARDVSVFSSFILPHAKLHFYYDYRLQTP